MGVNKRIKTGINVVVSICLCFLILVFINFIAARHYKKFDISKSQFYSLSEKTINVLNTLDEPVKVIVFFQPNQAMYVRVKRLLDEYKSNSDKIKVEFVDPAKDIARVKLLAEKYKIEHTEIVIFEYKDNIKYVYTNEIAEYDYSGVYQGRPPVFQAFKGEAAFTSAILSVKKKEQEKIYFTSGHGEKSITDNSEKGLARTTQILKENNYKTEEINLIGKEKLSDDIKILIIAGPVKSFMENEIKLLREFIKKGGKLLLLIDPLEYSGLESLMTEFGIVIGNTIVVDPARKLPFVSPANLFVVEYNQHEITKSMQNVSTLYPLARSISEAEDKKGFTVTELTKTSLEGWAEMNFNNSPFAYDEGKDVKGPVSIAVAAVGPKIQQAKEEEAVSSDLSAKVVVIGDSDFITNTQIVSLGNADFFTNSINWLMERKELIAISPKVPERVSLMLNASQMGMIFWLFVLGVPFLWLLIGSVVVVKRRK